MQRNGAAVVYFKQPKLETPRNIFGYIFRRCNTTDVYSFLFFLSHFSLLLLFHFLSIRVRQVFLQHNSIIKGGPSFGCC
jgi:hypothetical protein